MPPCLRTTSLVGFNPQHLKTSPTLAPSTKPSRPSQKSKRSKTSRTSESSYRYYKYISHHCTWYGYNFGLNVCMYRGPILYCHSSSSSTSLPHDVPLKGDIWRFFFNRHVFYFMLVASSLYWYRHCRVYLICTERKSEHGSIVVPACVRDKKNFSSDSNITSKLPRYLKR